RRRSPAADAATPSASSDPMFKTLEFARSLRTIRDYFNLIDKCGEGAFSAVFRARPLTGGDRCLAVKVISQCCDLQRTCTEILLLKALKGSPNVISLVSAVREAETVLLVMDYVEHRPFVEFYRQLQPDQVQHYMRCLLDALSRVHSMGVVHRDVKPSNALYNPATGQFALADFGLAHLVQQQPQRPRPAARPAAVGSAAVFPSNKSAAASCRCASGLVCGPCLSKRPIRAPRGGTNGYRPPEVLLQADSQDCRVDTWAAGCILAAFLSGRQPFLWCRSDTECLYLLCCLFGLNSMRSAAAAVGRELRVLPVASETLPEAEFPCRRDRLSSVCRLIRGTEAGSSDGPSSSVFDLLSGLLQADPAKRLTAADALKHPYFASAKR
ncbi:hypothetical protein BOX15_Mlig020213g2, partial [Macrostomum lignano]